jgi:RNA polymerase sigma-70 factor (ECF subfamily)
MEERIRETWEAGDRRAAAACAIETYGPEVLGWLVAATHDAAAADDAFGAGCEDLWTSFDAFRWECSVRTWLYTLCRRALVRQKTRAAERPGRRVELGSFDAAEIARSRTVPWVRTEVKDVFARLRAALDEGERELLVLRVDRELPWEDVATILGEDGAPAVASARLRKRFQNVKEKLRELARAEGLLEDEG